MADRVVVFSNGGIIGDGTPLEIFKNEKILKNSNLKRPIMLDVYETLIEKRILTNDNLYPKNINEFKKIFNKY